MPPRGAPDGMAFGFRRARWRAFGPGRHRPLMRAPLADLRERRRRIAGSFARHRSAEATIGTQSSASHRGAAAHRRRRSRSVLGDATAGPPGRRRECAPYALPLWRPRRRIARSTCAPQVLGASSVRAARQGQVTRAPLWRRRRPRRHWHVRRRPRRSAELCRRPMPPPPGAGLPEEGTLAMTGTRRCAAADAAAESATARRRY